MAEGPLVPAKERLILVVDDDDNVRSLIATAASLDGFRVITAVNGLDASRQLKVHRPDLIVTDLIMAGQGGYEFLRDLQATGGDRIPVFVVSGSNLDESTLEMIRREANVVQYFEKPIRVVPFMTQVHERLKTEPPKLRIKSW